MRLVARKPHLIPWFPIADNGSGMTRELPLEAMRFGSKNPMNARAAKNLGRFGLGLKSVSYP